MPEEYKEGMDNSVLAYRKYYANDKKDIAKWNKTRAMPDWYANGTYKEVPDYVNRAD